MSKGFYEPAIVSSLICAFLTIAFFAFRAKGVKMFDSTTFQLKINIKMVLIVIGFQLLVNVPFTYFVGSTNWESNFSFSFLFMVVIIAPILEELMFRGVLLRALLSKYSDKVSILISSILFALIHIHPVQMFGALFFGLYFGYIFVKTKSLTTVVILHLIANLIGVIAMYSVQRLLQL
jgi:membrane protease YdiL (CAAX protease family)